VPRDVLELIGSRENAEGLSSRAPT